MVSASFCIYKALGMIPISVGERNLVGSEIKYALFQLRSLRSTWSTVLLKLRRSRPGFRDDENRPSSAK